MTFAQREILQDRQPGACPWKELLARQKKLKGPESLRLSPLGFQGTVCTEEASCSHSLNPC
jgi:hypothetical protein